jgi:alkylhydroperoxidase family enzyme
MMMARMSFVAAAALAVTVGTAQAQPVPKTPPLFPPAGTDEAWKQLRGENPRLPAWARALANSLPRTTGSMLLLNHVHRAQNPLGPVLAGKLHWAAADALGCEYARKYAEADLRRAGLKKDDFRALAGDPMKLSEEDRAAVTFARKMTKAAYSVTDDEVAELLKQFGPPKVVAMVHTLAWANFQNRIVLALGVAVEPGGPLPPLDPHLDPERQAKLVPPARPPWEKARAATTSGTEIVGPDWRAQTGAELEAILEQQKGRKPRIPVPTDVKDSKGKPSKIVWTQVSLGYQPLLTRTWFDTMAAFQQESKLDKVFSNSYFWVITRSNECFY